ncbi:inosose dehydratase [Agromyces protaetiae]|uniref:Inosose dehydratase n=1 Tax=Agromyces protaetiae TaxID=2509455 RepID=A0A4P6F9K8_9MICO|nr:sugar phosphate isomerase/epimerase [Agromyces protaetiae]QAY72246.1 inosose dehydratase [Agromyces protaetiae]
MPVRASLAINPLPWMLIDDHWSVSEVVVETALVELAPLGYTAVHAEIPDGLAVPDYGRLLEGYGFRPAPGYVGGDFHDSEARSALLDRVRRVAAAHAELGVDVVFVASELSAERRALPAVGAHADASRLDRLAEGLAEAAHIARLEGVTAALHPHVASWVETEHETRRVLDATAGSDLAFGPDTGHLFWAGADPADIIADYRDRVVALHLKDVDAAARELAIARRTDYRVSTGELHVWAEPGTGAVDFDRVFDALPEDFDGWAVIEVDVPNRRTRIDSSRIAIEWARTRHELVIAP